MSRLDKWFLYSYLVIFGLFCLAVFFWQIQVLRGRSQRNPDGTTDDWHEQKLFFGMALADVTIAVPTALVGIGLIFWGLKPGYYLTGLASFWFLWANLMTTATSLRFARPRLTLAWFVAFPLGGLLALIYLAWSLVRFEAIFG
jgi:hypothetical protein